METLYFYTNKQITGEGASLEYIKPKQSTLHVHTLLESFAGFRCMWLMTLLQSCDVKFSQIEGNGRQFRHICWAKQ